MFTKQELSNGAKRVALEELDRNDLPIAEILTYEQAKIEMKPDLGRLNRIIIRGDTASQWLDFSDMYPSYIWPNGIFRWGLGHLTSVRNFPLEVLIKLVQLESGIEIPRWPGLTYGFKDGVDTQISRLRKYSGWLGLSEPPLDIKPLIQKAHGASCCLIQHPVEEGRFLIGYGRKSIFINAGKVERMIDDGLHLVHNGMSTEEMDFFLAAIDLYQQAVRLEKFCDIGYEYEMEFGPHNNTGKPLIYQLKPSRVGQTSLWILPEKEGEGMYNFNLVFGITPPEGIVLQPKQGYLHSGDYSDKVAIFIHYSGIEVKKAHVYYPNLQAAIYPLLEFGSSHGYRDTLSKMPFVLADCKEIWDGNQRSSNILHRMESDFRASNKVRILSDGRKGRLEIL